MSPKTKNTPISLRHAAQHIHVVVNAVRVGHSHIIEAWRGNPDNGLAIGAEAIDDYIAHSHAGLLC
jgi:hypothetical protein